MRTTVHHILAVCVLALATLYSCGGQEPGSTDPSPGDPEEVATMERSLINMLQDIGVLQTCGKGFGEDKFGAGAFGGGCDPALCTDTTRPYCIRLQQSGACVCSSKNK